MFHNKKIVFSLIFALCFLLNFSVVANAATATVTPSTATFTLSGSGTVKTTSALNKISCTINLVSTKSNSKNTISVTFNGNTFTATNVAATAYTSPYYMLNGTANGTLSTGAAASIKFGFIEKGTAGADTIAIQIKTTADNKEVLNIASYLETGNFTTILPDPTVASVTSPTELSASLSDPTIKTLTLEDTNLTLPSSIPSASGKTFVVDSNSSLSGAATGTYNFINGASVIAQNGGTVNNLFIANTSATEVNYGLVIRNENNVKLNNIVIQGNFTTPILIENSNVTLENILTLTNKPVAIKIVNSTVRISGACGHLETTAVDFTGSTGTVDATTTIGHYTTTGTTITYTP